MRTTFRVPVKCNTCTVNMLCMTTLLIFSFMRLYELFIHVVLITSAISK